MQHTVAAVFDQYTQAQQALDDVIAAGVPHDKVHLNQQDSSATSSTGTMSSTDTARQDDDDSFGAGIRNFFANLFGGSGHNDAELYSEAVRRGSYVLTVEVADESGLDTITTIIERNSPIDIEERASQWQSGGWAAESSMRNETLARGNMSGSIEESVGVTGQRTDTLQGSRANSLQRSTTDADTDTEQRIPVIEERLKVGKREVQRGGVRVYQRVVEQPVQESVQLREEHVKVERHPVDQPTTAADLGALQESSFEVRETAEEPVIEKTARVVEEVVVGTETTQRTEQINDTVRRTEVEVENLSGQSSGPGSTQDSERYRSHFSSTYGQSGRPYEDYVPAYQYGSSLASNQRYQGRSWNDIETDARTDWESRNPGSAWENFKAAVRHGWEKVSG